MIPRLRGALCRAVPWLTFLLVAACGDAPPAASPPGTGAEPPIAEIHRHKCSKCHVLPEPKTRTREHLEDAFARHRTRVHLTEDEWAAMVDYLAKP